jgi:hypothetical protein
LIQNVSNETNATWVNSTLPWPACNASANITENCTQIVCIPRPDNITVINATNLTNETISVLLNLTVNGTNFTLNLTMGTAAASNLSNMTNATNLTNATTHLISVSDDGDTTVTATTTDHAICYDDVLDNNTYILQNPTGCHAPQMGGCWKDSIVRGFAKCDIRTKYGSLQADGAVNVFQDTPVYAGGEDPFANMSYPYSPEFFEYGLDYMVPGKLKDTVCWKNDNQKVVFQGVRSQ